MLTQHTCIHTRIACRAERCSAGILENCQKTVSTEYIWCICRNCEYGLTRGTLRLLMIECTRIDCAPSVSRPLALVQRVENYYFYSSTLAPGPHSSLQMSSPAHLLVPVSSFVLMHCFHYCVSEWWHSQVWDNQILGTSDLVCSDPVGIPAPCKWASTVEHRLLPDHLHNRTTNKRKQYNVWHVKHWLVRITPQKLVHQQQRTCRPRFYQFGFHISNLCVVRKRNDHFDSIVSLKDEPNFY